MLNFLQCGKINTTDDSVLMSSKNNPNRRGEIVSPKEKRGRKKDKNRKSDSKQRSRRKSGDDDDYDDESDDSLIISKHQKSRRNSRGKKVKKKKNKKEKENRAGDNFDDNDSSSSTITSVDNSKDRQQRPLSFVITNGESQGHDSGSMGGLYSSPHDAAVAAGLAAAAATSHSNNYEAFPLTNAPTQQHQEKKQQGPNSVGSGRMAASPSNGQMPLSYGGGLQTSSPYPPRSPGYHNGGMMSPRTGNRGAPQNFASDNMSLSSRRSGMSGGSNFAISPRVQQMTSQSVNGNRGNSHVGGFGSSQNSYSGSFGPGMQRNPPSTRSYDGEILLKSKTMSNNQGQQQMNMQSYDGANGGSRFFPPNSPRQNYQNNLSMPHTPSRLSTYEGGNNARRMNPLNSPHGNLLPRSPHVGRGPASARGRAQFFNEGRAGAPTLSSSSSQQSFGPMRGITSPSAQFSNNGIRNINSFTPRSRDDDDSNQFIKQSFSNRESTSNTPQLQAAPRMPLSTRNTWQSNNAFSEKGQGQSKSKVSELMVSPGNVGISFHTTPKGPTVNQIHPNSVCPTLREGDIIVALDGMDVSHLPGPALSKLLNTRSNNAVRHLLYEPGMISQREKLKEIRQRFISDYSEQTDQYLEPKRPAQSELHYA